MLVSTLKERPFTFMFSIAFFLIAFLISSEISKVNAYSLTTSCISELKYDFTSPIHITNKKQEWNQNNQISSCNLSVKIDSSSRKNVQTSFIIKFETNATECESKNRSLLLEIFNDNLVSKQNLCEFTRQLAPLLINASQSFLINLSETNTNALESFPFKLIKSISITSFIYASQSMVFILFIYLSKFRLNE